MSYRWNRGGWRQAQPHCQISADCTCHELLKKTWPHRWQGEPGMHPDPWQAECVAAPLISSHYKHRRCVANARRHRRGSKCMPDRREPSNRPCFLQYMRTSCSESLLRYRCMEAISSTCGLFWWSMTWVFGWPVMYSLSFIWANHA